MIKHMWGRCRRTGVIRRRSVIVFVGAIVGRCRDVCVRWKVHTWRLQDGAVADPLGDFLDGGKVFFLSRNTLIIECVIISQGNWGDVWAPSIELSSRIHRVI